MSGKYEKIRSSGLKVFDLKDLSILLSLPLPSARVTANRLYKKGVLRRLRKDLYMLAENPLDDFEIANRLLSPSYISFESALNYWGVFTQIPKGITSASRRSKKYMIEEFEFSYLQLPEALFQNGFIKENSFFIATPEKALLDTAYYSSLGRKLLSDELMLDKINKSELKKLSKPFPIKTKKLIEEIF